MSEPTTVCGYPTNGSVIAYLGPDVDAFLREFAPFGFVVDTEHARDRAIQAMTTGAA